MHVYEKVQAYIVDSGMKLTAVSQKTGIPIATLNALLCGERTMYADDLKAICNALKVSPETFIALQSA